MSISRGAILDEEEHLFIQLVWSIINMASSQQFYIGCIGKQKGVSQSNSCYNWPDDLIGSSGLLLVILTPGTVLVVSCLWVDPGNHEEARQIGLDVRCTVGGPHAEYGWSLLQVLFHMCTSRPLVVYVRYVEANSSINKVL